MYVMYVCLYAGIDGYKCIAKRDYVDYFAGFHRLVDGRQGKKKSDKVKGSTLDQR